MSGTKEWSPNPASISEEMLVGLMLRMEIEKNAPEKIVGMFLPYYVKVDPLGDTGNEQVVGSLMTIWPRKKLMLVLRSEFRGE